VLLRLAQHQNIHGKPDSIPNASSRGGANRVEKGSNMKKLWIILSLLAIGLGGCYVDPYRDHDGGYRNGDHRGDRDRGEHRDRDHDRDRYHP
jgi:hypothetical protein